MKVGNFWNRGAGGLALIGLPKAANAWADVEFTLALSSGHAASSNLGAVYQPQRPTQKTTFDHWAPDFAAC